MLGIYLQASTNCFDLFLITHTVASFEASLSLGASLLASVDSLIVCIGGNGVCRMESITDSFPDCVEQPGDEVIGG